MALSTSILAQVNSILAKSFDLSVSPSVPLSLALQLTLDSGTGADQADTLFFDTRTLAGAATEDIDVYAPGDNAFGDAIINARAKVLVIRNNSTEASGTLTVGNKNTTAAWQTPFNASDTGAITIPPRGFLILTAPDAIGIAVANTTNHLLKILNNGSNSATYDIVLIGASA